MPNISTGQGVASGIGVSVGMGVGGSVGGGGVSVGTGVSVGMSVGVLVGRGVLVGMGVDVSVGCGVWVGMCVDVARGGLLLGFSVGPPDRVRAGCTMKTSTSSIAVPEFAKVIFTNRATTDPKWAVTVSEPETVPVKPARSESYTSAYSMLSLLLFPSE